MKLNLQFVARPATSIECECVHPDALTCIAEQHHMSRFNASLVFATGCERNGRCACYCHRDAKGQPVSEQDWQRAREGTRRIPRRANQASEAVFVAAPRRDMRGQERPRNEKGQYAR